MHTTRIILVHGEGGRTKLREFTLLQLPKDKNEGDVNCSRCKRVVEEVQHGIQMVCVCLSWLGSSS